MISFSRDYFRMICKWRKWKDTKVLGTKRKENGCEAGLLKESDRLTRASLLNRYNETIELVDQYENEYSKLKIILWLILNDQTLFVFIQEPLVPKLLANANWIDAIWDTKVTQ